MRAAQNFYLQEAFQAVIAAREGFGVAITDRIEVVNELREGSLVRLSDGVADGLHPIVMVSDAEERLSLRARVFISHLLKALQARLHTESTGSRHHGSPARKK